MAARPAQAADADRQRLLRPHPVGARRVRLLGVRRRLAAGAAAVVELPQGGRRRHHRRHAVPLALRARQPVRRREERDVPRRHAHSRALGRARRALRGHRRRRRLRDVRARARRHRADQQLVVHARAPRRPRDVPRRRHASAPRSPASPNASIQPRAATPKPVWNPDVPQTIDFYDTWQKVPANRAYDNAFKVGVGAVPAARRRGRRRSAGTCSKAPRACSSRNSACGAGPSGACSTCRHWSQNPIGVRAGHNRHANAATSAVRRAARRLHVARHADRGRCRPRVRAGIASRSPPRTSSPIRSRTSTRGFRPPSTGMRRSPTAATCGRRASASPRRWTPRSAAWASTGRHRSS